ncbi:MAG: hypothetical protein H6672_16780 [Anaerolineaceae bacterium]|nr:hypothetical protein [Anaerolineaceae bacterium]
MKQVCAACGRNSNGRNLSCTEVTCPLEKQVILGSGQIIGDIKVVHLVQITKTHALYEGLRQDKSVLLKVAHHDTGAKNQLIAESQFLSLIAQDRLKRKKSFLSRFSRLQDPHPGIPNILPAYSNAELVNFPYGLAQVSDQSIVYTVWDHIEGIPLSEYLVAVPVPWVESVAHIITHLAYIVELINKSEVLHGKLTPDAIWIQEDDKGILRPTLVDFGLLRNHRLLNQNDIIWLHENGNIAYVAPEIAKANNHEIRDYQPKTVESIDIYELGLLLYQMLAGKPKYDDLFKSRSQIVKLIGQSEGNPLIRNDIQQTNRAELVRLAKVATQRNPDQRKPDSLREFINILEKVVGKIPAEKPGHSIRETVWRVALVAGILVGAYLLIGVAINT